MKIIFQEHAVENECRNHIDRSTNSQKNLTEHNLHLNDVSQA